MRVYISGPMTGYEDYNRSAFMEAEKDLTDAGYEVFNPGAIIVDEDFNLKNIAIIDLVSLCECDGIYMLDGWEQSKGARAEYAVAQWIGLRRVNLYDE